MRLIHNMTTIAECPAPEHSPLGRVLKMAVIGGSGVGKTALVVRFLTRRFIGDYERNAGNLYSREVQVDGEQVTIQVQDTPGVEMTDNAVGLPDHVTCSVQWADAVVLVYSVTDRRSFDLIDQLHQLVTRAGGASMPRDPAGQQGGPAAPEAGGHPAGPFAGGDAGLLLLRRVFQRGLRPGPQRLPQAVLPVSQAAAGGPRLLPELRHRRHGETTLPADPQTQIPQHAGPEEAL
uniref:small monomeric GTPase n=1 Tax=Tetraodon nigroviridis TaxID=99883 RepID=H3DJW5_TETNG